MRFFCHAHQFVNGDDFLQSSFLVLVFLAILGELGLKPIVFSVIVDVICHEVVITKNSYQILELDLPIAD